MLALDAAASIAAASFVRRGWTCTGAGIRHAVPSLRGGAAVPLVGGATCVVAGVAFKCDSDGWRRDVERSSKRMALVRHQSSACECVVPDVEPAQPSHTTQSSGSAQPVVPAAATLGGLLRHSAVNDGSDFAIFRPPTSAPGNSESQGADPVSENKSLPNLLNAITAGICRGYSPAPREPEEAQDVPSIDVILLGEVHDDRVAHHLQLLVLMHCLQVCKLAGRRLVLSLEMFENDVQQVLDEYVVQKAIREQDFLQDSRPWSNYARDYRPLVELCRDHGVQVVAANAPRRYVSLTGRGGSKALQQLVCQSPENAQVRLSLPPLPLPPASAAYYQKFVETIASQMPPPESSVHTDLAASDKGECPFIGFKGSDVREARPEMIEAQLLWDHTMAQSIACSLQSKPAVGSFNADASSAPPLVIHICGAFHCSHGLGIPEVLPQYLVQPTQSRAPSAAVEDTQMPWLPMDESPLLQQPVPDSAMHSSDRTIGPKRSPPGVLSLICWPGCVKATLDAVRSGKQLPSLAIMGDWVIVTEETWTGEGRG